MKKNYFISLFCCAVAMLFCSTAKADGLADILGKYQFTATMTVAEGQDASLLSDNCEVTISKDGSFVYMDGLAGSDRGGHMISDVKDGKVIIKNWNDSNTGNFGAALYFSTTDAINPWAGTTPMPDFEMVIDADGNMTLPDFTVITVSDYESATGTVVATFTNAKLTLKEKETTDIQNISGTWTYTHGNGTYDYDKESQYTGDFSFTLTSKDDTNKNYTGVFSIDTNLGLSPITLDGTFDGVTLKFAYDKPVLFENETVKVLLGNPNGKAEAYGFQFGVIKSGVVSLDKVVTLIQIAPNAEDAAKVDTLVLQWYVNGKAECPELKEQGEEVDFTGKYTISGSYYDYADNFAQKDDEFTLEICKDDYGYYVPVFWGGDNSQLTYGGLGATVNAEDPNILEIACGFVGVKDQENFIYYATADMNAQTNGSIYFTKKADGTYEIEGFCVGSMPYGGEYAVERYYTGLTVTKVGGDAPTEKPEIAGDYTFTGNYCTMDDFAGVKKSFNVKIEENKYYEDYGGSKYLLTEFDGDAIYSLTYGGADLEIADETKYPVTINVKAATLVGGSYPDYTGLFNFNSTADPIALTITLNADGTCAITDFAINGATWGSSEAGALIGWYSGCTLTRGAYNSIATVKAEKASKGTFDMSGRKTNAQKGLMIRDGKVIFVK